MSSRNRLVFAGVALAAVVGGVAAFYPWSPSAEAQVNEKQAPKNTTGGWNAGEPAPFDGAKAMEYLVEICRIGPRISGTEGMAKQQALVKKHFEDHGATVVLQKFEGRQRSQPKACPMVNMIVQWNPAAAKRVILCAHYDTRPIADQEARRADWDKPFISANDGASGVAMFMELARHMKGAPNLKVGVDFVLFDGEEWIFDPNRDAFFIGSKYFADDYRDHRPAYKYTNAILFDLCAGKNAIFPKEENSRFHAGALQEDFWAIAKELKVRNFINERGPEVLDDHIALNRVGIRAIDIIDFDYKHWHKLSDLPEHCSGETMSEVMKVVTVWLQRQN